GIQNLQIRQLHVTPLNWQEFFNDFVLFRCNFHPHILAKLVLTRPSPFQLMAAWFVMLVLIVSVLLAAASQIEKPDWAAGYLVVFTSILILVVIGCVTLMLTKFRPHLQDGKEYAEWLKDKGRYSQGVIFEERKVSAKSFSSSIKKPQGSPKLITNADISVVNTYDSEEMIVALQREGFHAEIYEEGREPHESHNTQEAIWLGCRVDPFVACQIIKTAIKHWPHLKYIHLSNDGGCPPDEVHDQIFLGGSTETAKAYGIQKWAQDDFNNLNESMRVNDFHALVRAKYS
ncbi:MAG: hypothetical protein VR73_07585, partial [Gammaproteobacteria bacterium BRH_c0]